MPDIKNILIIYNPVSGHFLRNRWEQKIIQHFFDKRKINYTWLETKAENTKEIEKYLQKNFDRVLVAGGDGTVRDVAHYLIQHKKNTPLGIIPLGTSNIVAKGLGVPWNLRPALKYFIKNKAIAIDAGQVNNNKYFLISCGIGYDAKFLKATPRFWKKIFGPLAYFLIALQHSYSSDRIRGTLTMNNQSQPIECSAIIAFNVRSIIGRKKNFILKVHPGVLDVLITNEITIPAVLKLTHKLFRRNKPKYQDLDIIQTKKLLFTSPNKLEFEIDGDAWSDKKLEIAIIPQAIHVIMSEANYAFQKTSNIQ